MRAGRAFAFALAVLGGLPPAMCAGGNSRRDVLEAVQRLSEAGLHRNVAALERLYADDYFHTNPDGSIMSRSQVLASYRADSPFTFDTSRAEEQRVILRSGFAIVNELLFLHGEKRGAGKFTSKYRVTYVLEKRRREWKFVNSHSSLLGIEPEKSAPADAPPKE